MTARHKWATCFAVAIFAIAPARALAAASPDISIKQVRPGGGGASATSKPAPKVLAIVESSTPDVEPATRELIARARTLDLESGNFRRETEITQELTALLARGGPDAQRVIFDHWPLYKHRSRAMMIAALGAHFEKNELHASAVVPAEQAIGDIIVAVQNGSWQRGTAPYHVLTRMAQRAELTQRVFEAMRRAGAQPQQIAAVMKGFGGDATAAGTDNGADAVKRLHESAVSLTVPSHARAAAMQTLGLIESEPALKILIGIAAGTDPAVDGAELAPLNGLRRTLVDHENETKRQMRSSAVSALANRHFNSRNRDPKALAELEQTIIPVFGRVISSTQQNELRDRALDALVLFGTAGRLAIIDLYEKETDPPRARMLAERCARFSGYPYALLSGANQTTSSEGLAFRAAAARIMRLGVTNSVDLAGELLRMAEDERGNAESRRQATVALLERRDWRQRVSDDAIRRLLASPHAEVAAAAMKVLMRDGSNGRYFTATTVRPLFDSPQLELRQLAVRHTFQSHLRNELTPELVLPLLNSQYPDVVQPAARAVLSDDRLRNSVGVDTARRIGAILGTPTVDQIAKPNQIRQIWLTDIPPAPAAPARPVGAPGAMPTASPAGGVTSMLWSATWWTAGVFAAAIALVYLFAMLTVPEPRVAITRGEA